MKQFKAYESARVMGDSNRLPEGGYVCKVQKVKYVEGNETSDRLSIAFDIVEGEYANYFKEKFEADTNEDKKWKGVINVFIPNDDGTEKDGWTANAFRTMTNAFEASNTGYVWDWEEKKLEGKVVGIAFGITNNVINGRDVSYTEPRTFYPVESIRSGKFTTPKTKTKNGYGVGIKSQNDFMNIPSGVAEEIPF